MFTFNKKSDDYGEVAYYANKVINAPNGEIIDDFVFYTSDDKNFLAGYIGDATELVFPENYKGENYCIEDYAFHIYAFNGYATLTSVTIPNSVIGIGDYSFWGLSNITKITSYISADNLFAVGKSTFSNVDWKNCTLYVPYKAKEKYASTDGWKYFKNIVELRDTYKVTFCIDGKEVVAYDIKEGDSIVYPNEYEKEGYSLIWDTNIDIMSSCDITINGTYSVNSYTVTFMIDGEIYETATVEYGTKIELPTVPEKVGYTFSGWGNVSETMPAKDIIIQGSYIADTAIENIYLDLENIEVYNLKGVRITETDKLTRGIYIINGNKTFVK